MISIVCCSANGARAGATERRFAALFDACGEAWEFVLIPDAASMCEGYNRGVARAKGDAILFSHDDVEVLNPAFPALLRRRLSRFDALGVAGTTRLQSGAWIASGPPHIAGQVANLSGGGSSYAVCVFGNHLRVAPGMQALDGCLFAARREVCERVRFDEATFDAFHLYDVDFTFRAHLEGFRLAVCADWHVIHESPGTFDASWKQHAERFAKKHAGRLAPALRRGRYQFQYAEVYSKADAAAVMECPWWAADDERA